MKWTITVTLLHDNKLTSMFLLQSRESKIGNSVVISEDRTRKTNRMERRHHNTNQKACPSSSPDTLFTANKLFNFSKSQHQQENQSWSHKGKEWASAEKLNAIKWHELCNGQWMQNMKAVKGEKKLRLLLQSRLCKSSQFKPTNSEGRCKIFDSLTSSKL